MASSLHLDFVSDIACPWCAVGLHALDEALRRLAGEVAVSLHFQPFELNPAMPPEGEDTVAHLARKYGIDAAQIAQNQQMLRERGAAVGFAFGPRSRIWNTFDAHRLLHWAALADTHAGQAGAVDGHASRLKHALLQAYHGDGQNPADAAVLCRCAAASGLDSDAAAEVLAQGRHGDEVRSAQAHWRGLGISAVPSLVINQRHLVQGGQPPEAFEQALRQIAAAAAGAAGVAT